MSRRLLGIIPLIAYLLSWPPVPEMAWADASSELRAQAVRYRDEGVALQHRGELSTAMTALQKATQFDPGYAAPHNDLGIAYEMLGQVDHAIREYQITLALHPGYTGAHTNLALLYEQQGQAEQAAFHWMQRYRLGPRHDRWGSIAHDRLVTLGYVTDASTVDAQPVTQPHDVREREQVIDATFDALDQPAATPREYDTVTDAQGTTWRYNRP